MGSAATEPTLPTNALRTAASSQNPKSDHHSQSLPANIHKIRARTQQQWPSRWPHSWARPSGIACSRLLLECKPQNPAVPGPTASPIAHERRASLNVEFPDPTARSSPACFALPLPYAGPPLNLVGQYTSEKHMKRISSVDVYACRRQQGDHFEILCMAYGVAFAAFFSSQRLHQRCLAFGIP